MGRPTARAFLVLCLGVLPAACGSEAPKSALVAKKVVQARPKRSAAKPPTPPALYDAAGNLLPSGARVAWLELPRGLVEVKDAPPPLRAYQARGVPLDLIQAFFGARVVPARLDTQGVKGVMFSHCTPPEGGGREVPRMDVSVVPGPKDLVHVFIETHTMLPPTPALTEAQARATLREEAKRAE